VRALQGRRRGDRVELLAAAHARLPAGADDAAVAAAVRQVLAGRFQGRLVAVNLAPSDCEVRTIRLPVMPEEELAAAAEYEARERFPHWRSGWVFRIAPAGPVGRPGDHQQELLVMAATEAGVKRRLELLTKLGYQVAGLEPSGWAAFRPFSACVADQDSARLLLDVGAAESRILIGRGGQPVFLKSCAVGAVNFKDSVGAGGGDRNESATLRAARPAFEQLGKEVGLCLRYYAVTFRGQRPENIELIGEDADWSALQAALAESTQLQTCAADPFAGWVLPDTMPTGELPPSAWATAAGLALFGAKVPAEVGVAS
jgi:Tfp pilus assembly PilM family ATPase